MNIFCKHSTTKSAVYATLYLLLTGATTANAVPFDASNSIDPAYSGQSRPYGRPASAIGEGYGGRRDQEVPEGEVTEEDKDQMKFVLYPSIGVAVERNDNFYAEPVDKNSATIYRIRPALAIRSSTGKTNMGAGYTGSYSSYDISGGSQQDSTFDHSLYADATRAGDKIQMGANINYRRGHDEKGGIEDNVDFFDVWDQGSLAAWLNFGNPAARLNLRLDARTAARVQRDLSSIDVNSTAFGAMLKARVGNRTYGVLEGGIRQNDFQNSNQSANSVYGRLGVTWEATARTTGFISYGREQYNPDNSGELITSTKAGPAFGVIAKSTNSNWRGSMRWEATHKDSLLLATTRGTRISNGTGSHKVATRSNAAWMHTWSDRVRSNLAYAKGEDIFKGTFRVDDLKEYQVNLSYNFRRDMLFSGGWYYVERKSTVFNGNYDRNRFLLNFTWEL